MDGVRKSKVKIGSTFDVAVQDVIDYGKMIEGVRRVCFMEDNCWKYILVDEENKIISGPYDGCCEIVCCYDVEHRFGFWVWQGDENQFFDYKVRPISEKVSKENVTTDFMEKMETQMKEIYVNDKQDDIIKAALNHAVEDALVTFWDKLTFPYGIHLEEAERVQLLINALKNLDKK